MEFSTGTFWLTACQSLYYGESAERIKTASHVISNGALANFYTSYGESELKNCKIWFPNNQEAVNSQTPVQSNVPTLVFSGEYDGALDSTPTDWGRQTAAALSHSYFYVFPRTGHGSIQAGHCPLNIMKMFYAHPNKTPDARCIDKMKKQRPLDV
jgi:pimeloyl-ACP methyl ester carboxylesterase